MSTENMVLRSEQKHTLLALVVLEGLEGSKGCTTGNQLVTEAGLVVVVLVNLLIGILTVTYPLLDDWPTLLVRRKAYRSRTF